MRVGAGALRAPVGHPVRAVDVLIAGAVRTGVCNASYVLCLALRFMELAPTRDCKVGWWTPFLERIPLQVLVQGHHVVLQRSALMWDVCYDLLDLVVVGIREVLSEFLNSGLCSSFPLTNNMNR